MRERLLVRHFVRGFIDNDLISPDSDRHEVLSVICAALITAGLFVSVLRSMKYLFQPFQSPGFTALHAVDDHVFFITASMIVMALVAVAEWGALALDERDTLILGPLPVPRRMLIAAKLKAMALFALAFALALNVIPSVLHPSLMIAKLDIPAASALALIALHAAATMAAGAFGFTSIVGTRELLHAALGPALFRRVSAAAQALLLISLGTVLLLLPSLSARVASTKLERRSLAYALPPLWFVGMHESAGGRLIDRLPRPALPRSVLRQETESTAVYRRHQATFRQLRRIGSLAVPIVFALAFAAFLWNTRRLPLPHVPRPGALQSRSPKWGRRLASIVARTAGQRAGFSFTLQTLFRSPPHRLAIATFTAAGLAIATLNLQRIEFTQHQRPTTALLVIQTVLLTALMLGVRHAVRMPAELRANWIFQLSRACGPRAYVSGAKRAILSGIALPAVAILFGLHLLVLPVSSAFLHALCGLALSALLVETLFLRFRRPPFVAPYVRTSNLLALTPIGIIAFFAFTYAFAALERLALGGTAEMTLFLAVGSGLLLALQAVDRRNWRRNATFDSADGVEFPTQRLELSG
jgi:hypothetical protein